MKRCSWWSQMKNYCFQTCPIQGFSVININGSDPSTQCTITTIEIYSSMSKECPISVLLNKQSGRWSRQSEASAPLFLLHITGGSISMARCHGLPRVSRLFLMWQGHRELENDCAATPVHAQTHFQHLPPGRERQKASIEKTDWMNEWKSFVKTSCHRNNTEMMCVVLLDKPCLDKGCSKEKCCSALRLRDALIMLNQSVLPCFGGIKVKGFRLLCTTLVY